ncbi:phage FluMu protein gp41 [Paenibacillus mucilaginosus]|uniref:phage tail assembly protein n=1 Tax=Paenibacillus mucilaginosus TaxID=61624 RepID=UPI003D206AAE
MAFQTEYAFELPKGYVDDQGYLHRKGVMRLATAADEIIPLRDHRVQSNPSYLTIILLARVITKLGDLRGVDTNVVEQLFTADLAFLQNFYQEINRAEAPRILTTCPKCGADHEASLDFFSPTEAV